VLGSSVQMFKLKFLLGAGIFASLSALRVSLAEQLCFFFFLE
jgi:hypothetical protein